MNKYELRVIGASLVVLLMLSGCGGSDGTSAQNPDDEEVTISLNWWGSNVRAANTEKVVKQFEQEHPNIHVELQNADWSGYWDKLATSVAGGNTPDVIQMDQSYLSSYASQGVLLDLAQVGDDIDTSNIANMEAGQMDGTQYGIPYMIGNYGMVVNNDLLERIGVTLPDTDNWTWDEYVAFGKEVSEKSHGDVTIGTPLAAILQIWANQHGTTVYKDGKFAMEEKALTEFFQLTADMVANGSAGTADRWTENSTATLDQSDIGTGKQATGFYSASQLSALSTALGTENVSLEPIPSNVDGKWDTYGYSPTWTISAKSEHPKQAAMLIDYLVNSEYSAEVQGVERGIPSNGKIRESMRNKVGAIDQKVLDFTDRIEPHVGGLPEISPAGSSNQGNIVLRYQQDVIYGKRTAQEAARGLSDEMNKEIDAAA